jgi:F-type H+-transporting ATPase subunit delta
MTHSEERHSQPGGAATRGETAHATVFDVNTQGLARVYAEALLGAAEKHNQANELLQEVESLVRDVFAREPQWEAFLSSGAIGRGRKAEAIRSVFESRASELFVNFLLVLNDHERLDLVRPIAAAYRELDDERSGRIRVVVRSAVPLPDDQREHLQRELRETFHKEPLLETQVDPELLGGLVVRVDDWLYDQSVRRRLESLQDDIIARSSYEIQSRRNRFCATDGN